MDVYVAFMLFWEQTGDSTWRQQAVIPSENGEPIDLKVFMGKVSERELVREEQFV